MCFYNCKTKKNSKKRGQFPFKDRYKSHLFLNRNICSGLEIMTFLHKCGCESSQGQHLIENSKIYEWKQKLSLNEKILQSCMY